MFFMYILSPIDINVKDVNQNTNCCIPIANQPLKSSTSSSVQRNFSIPNTNYQESFMNQYISDTPPYKKHQHLVQTKNGALLP